MVELAAEKGMTLTTEEVREFLRKMDEESEFDDIELDEATLAAVYGGGMSTNGRNGSGMRCG